MSKQNIENCLDEVSQAIKKFLSAEGGYDNGYYTYVDGIVQVEKGLKLSWQTPVAKDELTEKGKEIRGNRLYAELQEILKKHNVNKIIIRHKDENYGAMETEVVYVEETIKRIWL